jgi:aspartate/methionine/tyrosine aminotransferase
MDEQTPSFYGQYDKVIAIGSLSKAYGLPGLRIGWAVGPVPILDDIWARHEYVTISATMLANKLAAIALSPQVRPRIIRRTRDYIRRGYPILEQWMNEHEKTFSLTPPKPRLLPLYVIILISIPRSSRSGCAKKKAC